jgi:hypothetical protein
LADRLSIWRSFFATAAVVNGGVPIVRVPRAAGNKHGHRSHSQQFVFWRKNRPAAWYCRLIEGRWQSTMGLLLRVGSRAGAARQHRGHFVVQLVPFARPADSTDRHAGRVLGHEGHGTKATRSSLMVLALATPSESSWPVGWTRTALPLRAASSTHGRRRWAVVIIITFVPRGGDGRRAPHAHHLIARRSAVSAIATKLSMAADAKRRAPRAPSTSSLAVGGDLPAAAADATLARTACELQRVGHHVQQVAWHRVRSQGGGRHEPKRVDGER